jgi:phage-related protein
LFQAGNEVELKELGEKNQNNSTQIIGKVHSYGNPLSKDTVKSVGNFVNTLKHVTHTLHLSENQNATYTQSIQGTIH